MDSNTNNRNNSTSSSSVSRYVQKNRLLVEMVRNNFLQFYQLDRECFYSSDIKMIQCDDWWTVRFLRANNHHPDKALEQMVGSFQWRKSFGILDRTLADLPIEFVNGAAIFFLGKDRHGRSVIYFRLKVHRKIPELDQCVRQYMAFVVEQVERLTGSKGYTMVYDFSGVGLANFDLAMFRFFTQLVQQHYPCGVRLALICNLPKICRPLWNASKAFIGCSAKNLYFCSREQLVDYIPLENIPRYLGGKSDFDFTNKFEGHDISGCKSVNELGPKFGFTQEQIDRLVKIFEPTLKEARLLVKEIFENQV